jgi:hypothetical protein
MKSAMATLILVFLRDLLIQDFQQTGRERIRDKKRIAAELKGLVLGQVRCISTVDHASYEIRANVVIRQDRGLDVVRCDPAISIDSTNCAQ